MNRRGFFGALAAAPLVAAGAKAETYEHKRVPELVVGEIRVMMATPDHIHRGYYGSAAPYEAYGVSEYQIWDGKEWIKRDSYEGITLMNKLVRASYKA